MRVCVAGAGGKGTDEHVVVGWTEEGRKRVVRTAHGGYVHSSTAVIDEKRIGWAGKPVIDD